VGANIAVLAEHTASVKATQRQCLNKKNKSRVWREEDEGR
jgi:hypothetical protein